jgi:hypothetical protein
MRSLAPLARRLDAIEQVIRPAPVHLRVIRGINLTGLLQEGQEEAMSALYAHLEALHAAGVCVPGCHCAGFCALRWWHLMVLFYCGPAGTLCAECSMGYFESSFALPGCEPKPHGYLLHPKQRQEHGSII